MAVVLITGCGGGFGQAMAREFARNGDEVYASVRALDPAGAARAYGEFADAIHTFELDVTSGASIDAAVAGVLANAGRIDVLVNNAGVHRLGAFEDMPEADIRLTMETNFFGPVRVTRAVLPVMRRQGAGSIVMMSSVGALVSRAADAYYCASKSALEAAAAALRYEVEPFGVKVFAIEPGAFKTDIAEKGAAALYDLHESAYTSLIEFRSRKVRESCRQGDDPLIVARETVRIAHAAAGEFRRPAGAQARMMVAALQGLDEAGKDAMIREKSQIDWWTRGGEPG